MQRKLKGRGEKGQRSVLDDLYPRLHSKEGENDSFRLVWQRERDGKQLQRTGVIRDRDGNLFTVISKVKPLTFSSLMLSFYCSIFAICCPNLFPPQKG